MRNFRLDTAIAEMENAAVLLGKALARLDNLRGIGMEIKLAMGVPDTEFSHEFVQGMANRISVSYFKYGKVMEAKGKVNEIEGLKKRLQKYEDTGNSEWLMDVANFAMIQFMHDGPEKFRATDSHESPGLPLVTGDVIHSHHTPTPEQVSAKVAEYYKRGGD